MMEEVVACAVARHFLLITFLKAHCGSLMEWHEIQCSGDE